MHDTIRKQVILPRNLRLVDPYTSLIVQCHQDLGPIPRLHTGSIKICSKPQSIQSVVQVKVAQRRRIRIIDVESIRVCDINSSGGVWGEESAIWHEFEFFSNDKVIVAEEVNEVIEFGGSSFGEEIGRNGEDTIDDLDEAAIADKILIRLASFNLDGLVV